MVESPGRCSHRCGRVTLQVLIRGTPFDHRCGRVAWQGLKKKKAEGSVALPSGTDPRTELWAPPPVPCKGRRPQNRALNRRPMGPSLLCALPGFRPLLSGRSGLSCRLLFWGFAPSLFVVVRFGGVFVRVLLFPAPCALVWSVPLSFSCFQRRATTQGPIFG